MTICLVRYADQFICLLFVVGSKTKTCLQKVKELEGKRQLLGAFKPKCQPNGLYQETQCHGMLK